MYSTLTSSHLGHSPPPVSRPRTGLASGGATATVGGHPIRRRPQPTGRAATTCGAAAVAHGVTAGPAAITRPARQAAQRASECGRCDARVHQRPPQRGSRATATAAASEGRRLSRPWAADRPVSRLHRTQVGSRSNAARSAVRGRRSGTARHHSRPPSAAGGVLPIVWAGGGGRRRHAPQQPPPGHSSRQHATTVAVAAATPAPPNSHTHHGCRQTAPPA